MDESDKHDEKTMCHVFCDYMEHYGIRMPARLLRVLVKEFFRSDYLLEPICALHYGKSILMVPRKDHPLIRELVLLDLKTERCERHRLEQKQEALQLHQAARANWLERVGANRADAEFCRMVARSTKGV